MVGFGVVRCGSGELGAIGEIVGVYGQVLTEGDPTDGPLKLAQSELLDAFRAGDGAELIRDAVRLLLQELIELEASERIGAARYERAESRVTDRNGARPRLLSTQWRRRAARSRSSLCGGVK